jgi:hypothetical protein
MTKLTGAFRNFAKSAQNFLITSVQWVTDRATIL